LRKLPESMYITAHFDQIVNKSVVNICLTPPPSIISENIPPSLTGTIAKMIISCSPIFACMAKVAMLAFSKLGNMTF
jgi:hypothetical protein